MAKIPVENVKWWQWALDAVFFLFGINSLLNGELKWGIGLIIVGMLAFGYDLWRWKLNGGEFSFPVRKEK
ncbi:MAG: hypothetical protein MK159_04780 [Halobacteriales archaeon]|nr:hypothetical protein [Halobacteriales archaeon]|tara:strand:+ start:673 stop:882 length:210 start_codon:yes stop_codon:yes gene_type:complete